MREFDWSYELAIYAGTAASLFVMLAVTGCVILLARYLLRRSRL